MSGRLTGLFNNLKNHLTYSSIWVALALACVYKLVSFTTNDTSFNNFLVCFGIGFIGYNYIYWSVYFISSSNLQYERYLWMRKNKVTMLIVTGLISFATITFIIHSQLYLNLKFIIFALLSLFYILPIKKEFGLRWIPSIKIFIICTSWTLLCLSLIDPPLDHPFTPLIIWLFIFAITLPFDIRDLYSDRLNLKTIPQVIGTKSSIKLAQLCLLLSVIAYTIIKPNTLIASTIFALAGMTALEKVKRNKTQAYINFYIEGLPILWFILIYVSNMI